MATGYLYSPVSPSPTDFTGYPPGVTTVTNVSTLMPNSQVKVGENNTHHKLLLTLQVSIEAGSMVVVQTMEGNSTNVVDSIGGSETIISGTLSESTDVRVGDTDVTVTLTTDGTTSSLSASAGSIQSESIMKVPGINGTLAVTASGMIHRRQDSTDYNEPFNLQVNGNSTVQIAASDRKFILEGAKTSQTTVNVPQPVTPPHTVTVTGVYAECTNPGQSFVSEV